MMSDGRILPIEEIKVGDKLMGADGKPRNVLRLYRGFDKMYLVKQARGINYRVNSQHILSLREAYKSTHTQAGRKRTYFQHKSDRLVNIALPDYLPQSGKWKKRHQGWKSFGLDFPEQKVNLDAYYLGLWLGDGTSGSQDITTTDAEVIEFLDEFAKENNCSLNRKTDVTFGLIYRTHSESGKGKTNPIRQGLAFYNLFKNKHIPKEYLFNSRKTRLSLLAGLIDSDGYFKKGYEISQKNESLADDILFLVCSLGFYATKREKLSKMKRADGSVYSCKTFTISFSCDDYSQIPVKITRKKCDFRRQKNGSNLYSKISLQEDGFDEYFGFEIDGDHLFLLEDFTVVHNTYNILIFLIIYALGVKGKTITIARQTMPSNRTTAMRDFFEILETLHLYDEKNHNKTASEYTLNGNLFEFIGLTESRRVRGRKRHIGYINEANETRYETFMQLAFRTTEKIIIDYNPSETYSYIYDSVENREDCDLLVTTYKDNPFLEAELVREIELLKDANPEYWKVYGLGEVAGNQKLVFSHFKQISEANFPYLRGEKILGLDFGYNNPSALVEATFWENTLFWRELLYESKLTNSQLIDRLRFIPEALNYPIFADCAEPDRIEEIRLAGFDCRPAYKNHKTTIDFVQSKPLRILESSGNGLREVKKYSWKTDKDGNIIDGEVVDFDNHAMDAARYASVQFGRINSWDFD